MTHNVDKLRLATKNKKAVEIQPLSPNAHYNLVQLYLKQNLKDEAIRKLQDLISTGSQAPATYITLALLYER